jgi:hypothetical protein
LASVDIAVIAMIIVMGIIFDVVSIGLNKSWFALLGLLTMLYFMGYLVLNFQAVSAGSVILSTTLEPFLFVFTMCILFSVFIILKTGNLL